MPEATIIHRLGDFQCSQQEQTSNDVKLCWLLKLTVTNGLKYVAFKCKIILKDYFQDGIILRTHKKCG